MTRSLLVRGGKLIDGTGNPWRRADVLVIDDMIGEVAHSISPGSADKVLDVDGLFVTPGFIDAHSHSDLAIISNPLAEDKVYQGVTTEIVGNCGLGLVPCGKNSEQLIRESVASILGYSDEVRGIDTVASYLNKIDDVSPSVNIAVLLTHGTIRASVMGFDDREPGAEELRRMRQMVDQGMAEGAVGISTGLVYSPACYATTEEITELCRSVAGYGGLYAVHLKDQGDKFHESIEDTIRIGRDSGVRVHISHHKAIGKRNKGKVKDSLSLMKNARERGMCATSDVYPYTSGSAMLTRVLPGWALEGGIELTLQRLQDRNTVTLLERDFREGIDGWENIIGLIGWDNIVIASVASDKNRHVEGLSIRQLAHLENKSPVSVVCDLIVQERGQVTHIAHVIEESDLIRVMQDPGTMIGTDGLPVGSKPHPRRYHTFPRVLGRYVRELGTLCFEGAVRKMTSLPAQTFGLCTIGQIRVGARADITIFDATSVKDTGTYENPRTRPQGIEYVIVGGEIVIDCRRHTGRRPGRALRKAHAVHTKV